MKAVTRRTNYGNGSRLEQALSIAVKEHRWILSTIGLLVFLASAMCHADDVVLIHAGRPHSEELKQIQKISDFVGLTLDSIQVDSPFAASIAVTHLKQRGTLGVLISYEALAVLDRKQVLEALGRHGRGRIPVLIFGVSTGDNSRELMLWSEGVIHGCTTPAKDFRPGALRVEDTPALAHSLAGLRFPSVTTPACTLRFEAMRGAETVLSAEGIRSHSSVLLRARSKTDEIFFAPQMEPSDISWVGNPSALPQAFSSLAPYLLFINHVAGDYGWHMDGHYANLTIDDPWLIEPYGHLYYGALLEEMEKHNFHTTIAFIPWNYDRSRTDVVDLIRAHPERYSICIHGNNHSHREFGDYIDSPLQEQVANLKQAVTRMEKFRELTGISYDRFMIFPHSVAPEATFSALKMSDFMGTANSLNVPRGSFFPADPAFLLRPYTLSYGDFLSLFRYSAEAPISRIEIAIQSFLGNPLLFYGHEKLFDNGIGEFDKVADLVNQFEPDTQWTSLGELARHFYLVRRREDGQFDVRMLSNEMALRNKGQRDAVFHVELVSNGSTAMPSLLVDGAPSGLERSGNMLTFRLMVPAGQVKHVRLRYQREDVTAADLGKSGPYASALRHASDFRDLYLSRFSLGRVLTEAYYRHGWDSLELRVEIAWKLLAAGMIVALAGTLCFLRRKPARELVATHEPSAKGNCPGTTCLGPGDGGVVEYSISVERQGHR